MAKLGEALVATPAALDATTEEFRLECIARYLLNDWGELDKHDWAMNDRAAEEKDNRILAAYPIPGSNDKLWIITEWDYSATTLLLPSDY